LSKAYVDRNKLTDHHAILPTGRQPAANLPPELRRIYDLVTTRFVAIFLPDQVVEETTVELDIGGATFVARGSVERERGWKIVESERADGKRETSGVEEAGRTGEDAEEEQELPSLRRGQMVQVDGMDVVEKETRPPRPYNDATLLGAMKNAGRDLDDEALADAMKESGLGTPATRAEMIEKLIRTGYVQREGRQLRSTSKGQALIGLVAEALRSPELTAEWEQQLKDVEEGRLEAASYYHGIADFVRALVPRVALGPALSAEQLAEARQLQPGRRGKSGKSGKSGKKGKGKRGGGTQATDLGPCPLCEQGAIFETAKAYGCSRYREGCGFTIWKSVGRRKLPKKAVKQLIREGRTERLEGFVSKAGKKFAARLKLGVGGKVEFDFDDGGSRPEPTQQRTATSTVRHVSAPASTAPEWPLCPKCGRGRIIQGKRGYGCNRYREGCEFVVWQQVSGKKLTENQVRTLIETGKTRLIHGFISPTGEKFAAQLQLDEQGKTVLRPPEGRSD
jgi:DNA topoisomerase-3